MKGPSIAALIPQFDISKAFVPDYMHAVLLGIVRMLLFLWFQPKYRNKPFHVDDLMLEEIEELLCDIKPPSNVTRTPRPVEVTKHWKASELRAFLLCYAPIILKDKLAREYYDHFLLLVRGIHILLQSEIKAEEINLADTYLYIFVSDFEGLYGLEKCSFNLHSLLHLAPYVRLWGPLWPWSAFPFEDGNGYLVRMAHGTINLGVELTNTMLFAKAHRSIENLMQIHALERNYEGITLGPGVKSELTEENLVALSRTSQYSKDELKNMVKFVYTRIELRNEKYTSLLYTKGTKRTNYCICWNQRQNFGNIKFFVKIEHSLFAII